MPACFRRDDVTFHDDCVRRSPASASISADQEIAYLGWLPRWTESETKEGGYGRSRTALRLATQYWTTHAYFISLSGAVRLYKAFSFIIVRGPNLSE